MDLDKLALELQPHYSRFDVANRLLFSGHSHQAWPDVARDGILECFDDAATYVDGKWGKTFERVDVLRNYLREWYNDPTGKYTPAASTHDLLIKWLSALNLQKGDQIVTTGGEFYSIFRQSKALIDAGIQVKFIDTSDYLTIDERLYAAITAETKAVMVSRVFFETGLQLLNLKTIAERCVAFGIPMLIDDYHGTNVVPTQIRSSIFEQTYWLIGGYKYLQWGEGNCFIRYPQDCRLKPSLTGWFASFSTLHLSKSEYTVQFDDEMKFAGGTFDPVSAYRASNVVQFFKDQKISKQVISTVYRRRVTELRETFVELQIAKDKIRLASNEPEKHRAGFMALYSKNATELQKELLQNGVYTDARGHILRFGAAPYITSKQIQQALHILKRICD